MLEIRHELVQDNNRPRVSTSIDAVREFVKALGDVNKLLAGHEDMDVANMKIKEKNVEIPRDERGLYLFLKHKS
jgi:hypothetical protein